MRGWEMTFDRSHVGTRVSMERREDFRQRALNTANMLLEAADRLESTSSANDRTLPTTGPGNALPPSRAPPRRAPLPPAAATSSPSFHTVGVGSELRSLFNWKNKPRKRRVSASGPSKKPKVRTWTHTWVCLGRTSDDTVPDASERATLKLAGLGERRFAVDVSLSAQDMLYSLEAQFPKLMEGGGLELLRADEGGCRELQPIEMPAGGYTCEYLKAVVHSAKIYIRPLQDDLNLEPCSTEVSEANAYSIHYYF